MSTKFRSAIRCSTSAHPQLSASICCSASPQLRKPGDLPSDARAASCIKSRLPRPGPNVTPEEGRLYLAGRGKLWSSVYQRSQCSAVGVGGLSTSLTGGGTSTSTD